MCPMMEEIKNLPRNTIARTNISQAVESAAKRANTAAETIASSRTVDALSDVFTDCAGMLNIDIPHIVVLSSMESFQATGNINSLTMVTSFLILPNGHVGVGIQREYLERINSMITQGPEEQQKIAEMEIQSRIAEEMYHYHQHLKDRVTSDTSVKANEGSRDEYVQDAGEQAAKGFALKYLLAKYPIDNT
jgi:hypothetical protein